MTADYVLEETLGGMGDENLRVIPNPDNSRQISVGVGIFQVGIPV
jgi:hypothetical protein